MPCINLPIQSGGPLVQVYIGVSVPRQKALTAASLPIPSAVSGTFLIDTGASCTCVDPTLIAALGIPPTGSIPIQTPSTQGTPCHCNQYDVMLFIPDSAQAGHLVEAMPIIETPLSNQGIDGLIGRDVLDRCVLIYNGSNNQYTLTY